MHPEEPFSALVETRNHVLLLFGRFVCPDARLSEGGGTRMKIKLYLVLDHCSWCCPHVRLYWGQHQGTSVR